MEEEDEEEEEARGLPLPQVPTAQPTPPQGCPFWAPLTHSMPPSLVQDGIQGRER